MLPLTEKNILSHLDLEEVRKKWEALKLVLFNSVDKHMFSYIDSDLNAMAIFLEEHKHYLSEETYISIMNLLDLLCKRVWAEAFMTNEERNQLSFSFLLSDKLLE